MQLKTLMYLSRSMLTGPIADTTVGNILAASRINNARLGLTGALMFTGEYFAQVLEGQEAHIDDLMAILAADPRHAEIKIVSREYLGQRRFDQWSMAYVGPSVFVRRCVRQLLANPVASEASHAVTWLEHLMIDSDAMAPRLTAVRGVP